MQYESLKEGQHVTIERLYLPDNVTDVSRRGADLSIHAKSVIAEVLKYAAEVFAGVNEELRPMTPERVKLIRDGLGLSQEAFSQMLRLGTHGKRTVARWEAGDNPVPGPASVALEALEAGWRPGDGQWHEVRSAYLSVLDAIEGAVLQAREHVRNTGGRVIDG